MGSVTAGADGQSHHRVCVVTSMKCTRISYARFHVCIKAILAAALANRRIWLWRNVQSGQLVGLPQVHLNVLISSQSLFVLLLIVPFMLLTVHDIVRFDNTLTQ